MKTAEEIAKHWNIYFTREGEPQNDVISAMEEYSEQFKQLFVNGNYDFFLTDEKLDEDFRGIISHQLLGVEDNINRESFNDIVTECVKYVKELIGKKHIKIKS